MYLSPPPQCAQNASAQSQHPYYQNGNAAPPYPHLNLSLPHPSMSLDFRVSITLNPSIKLGASDWDSVKGGTWSGDWGGGVVLVCLLFLLFMPLLLLLFALNCSYSHQRAHFHFLYLYHFPSLHYFKDRRAKQQRP